jgi:hypothetical protein
MSSDSDSLSDLHSMSGEDDGEFDIKKAIPEPSGPSFMTLSLPWKILIGVIALVVLGVVIGFVYTNFLTTNEFVPPGNYYEHSFYSKFSDNNNNTVKTFSLFEIFPRNVSAIRALSQNIVNQTKLRLDHLTTMEKKLRTYENTIYELQVIEESYFQVENVISLFEYLHPDDSIRKESHLQIIALQGTCKFYEVRSIIITPMVQLGFIYSIFI